MKKWFFFTALIAVALALTITSSGRAEEGVSALEIQIGQWGPQTGPAAAWGSIARGTGAYFKMINAQGGINGRKIVYHMFDDAYNPAKTLAGVKELQEGIGMFAWVGGVGTAPGLAVKDYLMKRGIPWVGPSSGSLHWITPPEKYLFTVYPMYVTEARILCRYAVEKLGRKKFAIIYQNDDYGKNGVKGAREELARHGMKLVAEVPVAVKEGDLKPHVMKLKKSGADAVLLWTSVKHAVMTVGISKAMKFEPQFLSTSTCSDFVLMNHISKGLWKGVIASSFAVLPDSGNPLLKKYKTEAFDKYAGKDERWGLFFYAGFAYAEPLVEAIRQCGKDLTRENLVRKLEGLRDFQGVSGKISYAPFNPGDVSCRRGQNSSFLVQCLEGGKYKKLTDWITISD
jgi:ABC-type branched-subunit amino acid transport system substrate-binding protein